MSLRLYLVPGSVLEITDTMWTKDRRSWPLSRLVWKGGQSFGCNYKIVINVMSEGFSEEELLELQLDRWVWFNLVHRVMRLMFRRTLQTGQTGQEECGASEQLEEMGGTPVARKVDMAKRCWPGHGKDFSSILIPKQWEAIKDNFNQNFIIASSRFFLYQVH